MKTEQLKIVIENNANDGSFHKLNVGKTQYKDVPVQLLRRIKQYNRYNRQVSFSQ